MITENLIKILMSPVFGLLNLLPTVYNDCLEVWAYVREILIDIFTGIGCFIPLSALATLLYAVVALHVFRIILAVIVRIKSFPPFWGGNCVI